MFYNLLRFSAVLVKKKNPHFFRVSSFFSLMILAKKFGNFFQTKQKTTAQSLTSVRCKYLLYYFLLKTTKAAPASAARPILMPIAASVLGFVVLLGFVVVFDDEAAVLLSSVKQLMGDSQLHNHCFRCPER